MDHNYVKALKLHTHTHFRVEDRKGVLESEGQAKVLYASVWFISGTATSHHGKISKHSNLHRLGLFWNNCVALTENNGDLSMSPLWCGYAVYCSPTVET